MTKNVLIVDAHQTRYVLRQILSREGYEVSEAGTYEEGLELASSRQVDLALVDVTLEGQDLAGLEVLRRLAEQYSFPVIMTTNDTAIDVIRSSMRSGAFDYLVKPLSREVVLSLVRSALDKSQIQRQIREAKQKLGQKYGLANFVASSDVMQSVKALIRQVASHDASVMILGESGTGKEMVARAIHMESARQSGPFVAINCGALPRDLVEAELFGYEKGAFTGASSGRAGKFELANGGTLFLDEIGEMPPEMQVKLLRVLEERRLVRIGSKHEVDVDFRVVCATNADVEAQVQEGTFRRDLYYRLNVIKIPVPPLRERDEDIVLLAEAFLRDFTGREIRLGQQAREVIRDHWWEGNVRELRNAVERATILAGTRYDEIDEVLIQNCRQTESTRSAPPAPQTRPSGRVAPRESADMLPLEASGSGTQQLPIEERLEALIADMFDERDSEREDNDNLLSWVEEKIVWAAFVHAGYNKAKAARLIGIDRKAFERRVTKIEP